MKTLHVIRVSSSETSEPVFAIRSLSEKQQHLDNDVCCTGMFRLAKKGTH